MTELSVEAQQKLLQLKQEYLASFPKKITQMQNCWQNLQSKKFPLDGIDSMRVLFHKIAGSSGSYEMHDIFLAAQSAEEICKRAEFADFDLSSFQADLEFSYKRLIGLMQKQA